MQELFYIAAHSLLAVDWFSTKTDNTVTCMNNGCLYVPAALIWPKEN